MVGDLWNGVAGKLAERWIADSVPAFLFWLAAWYAFTLGDGKEGSVGTLTHRFDSLSGGGKIMIVALGLAVIGGSAALVDRLTVPAARLLEGYWPGWFKAGWERIGARLRRRPAEQRVKDLIAEYMRLSASAPTAGEQARLVTVQGLVRRYPADPGWVMPTALGNILRAMEERPRQRYGLETILVWPHLWFTLPTEVRTDITAARAALDRSVAAVVWGTATVLLLVFTPWALVPLVVVPVVAYRFWVLPSAVTYADLVSAAFDLYRLKLYGELHLEEPKDAAAERQQGMQLSQYLLAGRPPDSDVAL